MLLNFCVDILFKTKYEMNIANSKLLIPTIGTFYRHLIIQATRIVLSKVSQALKACYGSPMLLSALSVKNLFRLLIPIHKAFRDAVLEEAPSMKMLNINFLANQKCQKASFFIS